MFTTLMLDVIVRAGTALAAFVAAGYGMAQPSWDLWNGAAPMLLIFGLWQVVTTVNVMFVGEAAHQWFKLQEEEEDDE